MLDSYVAQRTVLFVGKRSVDLVECLPLFLAFDDDCKGGMLAVKVVEIVAQCDEELRSGDEVIWPASTSARKGHGDCAASSMAQ